MTGPECFFELDAYEVSKRDCSVLRGYVEVKLVLIGAVTSYKVVKFTKKIDYTNLKS